MKTNRLVRLVYAFDLSTQNSLRSGSEVLYWQRVSNQVPSKSPSSLMDYIDKNGDVLRPLVREAFSELKSIYFDGSPLASFSAQSGDLLWKLSRFEESANYDKSPAFDELVKIVSLKNFINEYGFSELVVEGFPRNLAAAIFDFCPHITIRIIDPIDAIKLGANEGLFNRIGKIVGYATLLTLRSIWWQLKKVNFDSKKSRNERKNILFLDYLYDFDISQKKEYRSSYWGELPARLDKLGYSLFWLHLFVPHPKVRNLKRANEVISVFNRVQNHHRLFEFEIQITEVVVALFRTIVVLIKSNVFRLHRAVIGEIVPGWSIFSYEWIRSFESTELMKNFLFVLVFKRLLQQKRYEVIVYVCENQPWEKALCYASIASGQKNIVASLQSSVRFWDCRYLGNLQTEFKSPEGTVLTPKFVAITGEQHRIALQEVEGNALVAVESYRINSDYISFKSSAALPVRPVIAIIGEYSDEKTRGLFELISELPCIYFLEYKFIFKGHPSSFIKIPGGLCNKVSLVNDDMSMDEINFALTTANTSFVLDCYLRGVEIISYVAPWELNMSPLVGIGGASFFSDRFELEALLRKFRYENPRKIWARQNLFNTGSGSEMWVRLIRRIEGMAP